MQMSKAKNGKEGPKLKPEGVWLLMDEKYVGWDESCQVGYHFKL